MAAADSFHKGSVEAGLRACKLWRTATDDGVARLATVTAVERHPRGAVLAAEGEAAERFGVLLEGKTTVYHLAANGRRIIFEKQEAGDPIAAVAALAGGRYPAFIEAATPVTIAWLPRQALFDLIETEPAVARSVVTDLSRRVVGFTTVVQSMALDVPQRLARYLFDRALSSGSPTPGGLVVSLDMSKGELASVLGTVPETLSRALAKLKSDGVLESCGKDVVVFDVGALARLGAGYDED